MRYQPSTAIDLAGAMLAAAGFLDELFSFCRALSRRVVEVDALTGSSSDRRDVTPAWSSFSPGTRAWHFCVCGGAIFFGARFSASASVRAACASGFVSRWCLDASSAPRRCGAIVRELQPLLGRCSGRAVFVMHVTVLVGPFIDLVCTARGADRMAVAAKPVTEVSYIHALLDHAAVNLCDHSHTESVFVRSKAKKAGPKAR